MVEPINAAGFAISADTEAASKEVNSFTQTLANLGDESLRAAQRMGTAEQQNANFAKALKANADDQLASARKSIRGVQDELDDLQKKPSKGLFDLSRMFPSGTEMAAYLAVIKDVAVEMGTSIANGFQMAVGNDYAELRSDLEELAVSYGESATDIEKNLVRLQDMTLRTGISIEQSLGLEVALRRTGLSLTELTETTRDRLIKMNQFYGVSADRIAEFQSSAVFSFGATAEGAESMNQFMENAVQLSQVYAVDGKQMLESLADVAKATQGVIDEFGSTLVGGGAAIAFKIQKSSAQIAKAFNVTIAEAVGQASEVFNSFTGELSSLEDIQLGLSDGFGQLGEALLENMPGISSIQDLTQLLELGRDSPLEFATRVRDMAAAFGEGSAQGRRLIKTIAQASPQMLKTLINNPLAYQANLTVVEKSLLNLFDKSKLKNFDEFSNAFSNTYRNLNAMFNALTGVGKVIIGELFYSLKDSFEGLDTTLVGVAEQIRVFANGLKDPSSNFQKYILPAMTSFSKLLLRVGGSVASVMSGAGGLAPLLITVGHLGEAFLRLDTVLLNLTGASFTSFIHGTGRFLGNMTGLGKAVPKVTSSLLGFASKALGPTLSFFGKFAGSAAKAIGGLLEWVPGLNLVVGAVFGVWGAVDELYRVFSDPSATGMDKFVGVFMAGFKGIWEFVDALAFGLPGLFLDIFFPNFEKGMWDGLRSSLKNIFASYSWTEIILSALNPTVFAVILVEKLFGWNNISSAFNKAFNVVTDFVMDSFLWIGRNVGWAIGAGLRVSFNYIGKFLSKSWSSVANTSVDDVLIYIKDSFWKVVSTIGVTLADVGLVIARSVAYPVEVAGNLLVGGVAGLLEGLFGTTLEGLFSTFDYYNELLIGKVESLVSAIYLEAAKAKLLIMKLDPTGLYGTDSAIADQQRAVKLMEKEQRAAEINRQRNLEEHSKAMLREQKSYSASTVAEVEKREGAVADVVTKTQQSLEKEAKKRTKEEVVNSVKTNAAFIKAVEDAKSAVQVARDRAITSGATESEIIDAVMREDAKQRQRLQGLVNVLAAGGEVKDIPNAPPRYSSVEREPVVPELQGLVNVLAAGGEVKDIPNAPPRYSSVEREPVVPEIAGPTAPPEMAPPQTTGVPREPVAPPSPASVPSAGSVKVEIAALKMAVMELSRSVKSMSAVRDRVDVTITAEKGLVANHIRRRNAESGGVHGMPRGG